MVPPGGIDGWHLQAAYCWCDLLKQLGGRAFAPGGEPIWQVNPHVYPHSQLHLGVIRTGAKYPHPSAHSLIPLTLTPLVHAKLDVGASIASRWACVLWIFERVGLTLE